VEATTEALASTVLVEATALEEARTTSTEATTPTMSYVLPERSRVCYLLIYRLKLFFNSCLALSLRSFSAAHVMFVILFF
jgi:hypothetical protein